MSLRIVVADDSAILREGLAGLLERRGHSVVGQASSAPSLEAVVDKLRDDLPTSSSRTCACRQAWATMV